MGLQDEWGMDEEKVREFKDPEPFQSHGSCRSGVTLAK